MTVGCADGSQPPPNAADEGNRPLYLVENEDDTALLRSILRAGIEAGIFRPLPLDVAVGLAESLRRVSPDRVK